MSKLDLVLLHAPSIYDFRKRPALYGPISDVVPPTPIFEMYPVGFATMAEYLERHGYTVRIVNLAVHMLRNPNFDPEALIASLNPVAFGIDLHWLPHAHGALEVARIVKQRHQTPVIMGGLSASYYHKELAARPEVDYVIRGDSTEIPLLKLMNCLAKREGNLEEVPNLTWKDEKGEVHANPLTHLPQSLEGLAFDYRYPIRATLRDRDITSYTPFFDWLSYPIMAGMSCRGCTQGCIICGGSAYASRGLFGREKPVYREPEALARDVKSIAHFSRGPIFIIGDIRQAGMDYARRFLKAAKGVRGQVIMEIFWPADKDFFQEVASSLPSFSLEMSLESHSQEIRKIVGRPYSTDEVRSTIAGALSAGCRRLDVFFMIGLPHQDPASVMETVEYCADLLDRFGDGRLHPFISPLAPFLDPGSLAFENPLKYGYRILFRTLEEHRQALLSPSWKYFLNYETEWMTRQDIAATTYTALLRLARVKREHRLISETEFQTAETRLGRSQELLATIDDLLSLQDKEAQRQELLALKPQLDEANFALAHEKRELALPVGWFRWNPFWVARLVLSDWWSHLRGRRS